jgi:hypothetical protein
MSIATGMLPDERIGEAVEHVGLKKRDDGTWKADWMLTGRN